MAFWSATGLGFAADLRLRRVLKIRQLRLFSRRHFVIILQGGGLRVLFFAGRQE